MDLMWLLQVCMKIQWLPSVLTCQGALRNGNPICPTPEQCKGDLYFDFKPAEIDFNSFYEIRQRQMIGASRIFQPQGSNQSKSYHSI